MATTSRLALNAVAGMVTPGADAVSITELNAGDSSRASHVWRVDSPGGSEILRRAWWIQPDVSPFMLGLARLFGTDPRDLEATADTYRFWQGLDVWAVPEPLGLTDFQGAPALRMEFVPGEAARGLADTNLRELGRRVARIHRHTSETYGDVLGKTARPVAGFYPHALTVARELAAHFDPQAWAAHWPEVDATFGATPLPTHAVPKILDWDGSQFIWRGGQPFALVDVEASALAPPELDLCHWEILLTPAQAQEFRGGYAELQPFPNLGPHRRPCRLILRALEVEGSPPLADWLALPHSFEP